MAVRRQWFCGRQPGAQGSHPTLPTGIFPATAICYKRSDRLRFLRLRLPLKLRSSGLRRRKASPAESARATLRAVGTGYLKFALAERGLFRTAFSNSDPVEDDVDVAKTGKSGLNPFQLLSSALDPMAGGRRSPARTKAGRGVSRVVCRPWTGYLDHRRSAEWCF
jgi:hypothetical protein